MGTILLESEWILTISNTTTDNGNISATPPNISFTTNGAGNPMVVSVGAIAGLTGNVVLQATGNISLNNDLTLGTGESRWSIAGGRERHDRREHQVVRSADLCEQTAIRRRGRAAGAIRVCPGGPSR